MRPRLAVLCFASLGVAYACSSNGGSVQLAPTLIFPQGLLDTATKVSLTVYDTSGGIDCNTSNGNPTNVPANTTPLATKDLATTGCAAGVKFCGDIQIDESSVPRVFSAVAYNGANPILAGCSKVTVNQATLQVQIKMLKYFTPPLCGGAPSPVPTQCKDPGSPTDPICDANCLSKEMYLSPGDSITTFDGKPKFRPQLVWPAGSGEPGRMLGFWGEQRAAGTQVSMRVLGDDLSQDSTQGPEVAQFSFRLPDVINGGLPPVDYTFPQNNPAAATLNGNYFVAFEDGTSGATDIKMRSMTSILNPLQSTPLVVSDASGSAQALPSMAVSGGNLLVAWEASGTVYGKMVSSTLTTCAPPCNKTLGTGSSVSVAPAASGWVAAFQSGSDIEMVKIDATGTPGTLTKVNDATHTGPQVHPGVAVLANGTTAVVWLDTGNGNVYLQRYDATGKALAGDQATPLNSVASSAQAAPSVASGGTYFVATWVDTNGHVRGRFPDDGTSGFLYNSVNGQLGDFQASTLDGETRANPTAVAGGSGPYVLIAWEDNAGANQQGIYGRRFPAPQ